jgi:hypothetical protein
MEIKIALDNLDGFAMADGEEEASPLVITATDDFQEGEENEKNYISFNVEIGAKAARFLALKSDVKEFFKALKKEIND